MKREYLSSSKINRRGFVLFVVLIMVGVLAPVLFSIYTFSSLNYDRTENFKNYLKAYHGAVSAVKVALYFLKHDNNNFDGVGDDWYKPIFYNYKGLALSVTIRDECGKLDVNKLSSPLYYRMAQRLIADLNLDESLADVLKDWVDRDSEVTGSGAESFYYNSLGYSPTNGPMKSIYELYYLKGISPGLFKKLSKFLTVYGSGKVNVNSAPKEVLLSLSRDMTETAADSIIESRPITNIEKLEDLPGIDKELYFKIRPFITNRCDYFRVDVVASYGGSTAEVVAYTDRNKVLEWKVVQ